MNSELRLGPELDLAVAKACAMPDCVGIYSVDGSGRLVGVGVEIAPGKHARYWRPSTDLNDAFEAAERVGLFDFWSLEKDAEESLWTLGRIWYCYSEEDCMDGDEVGWNYESLDGIGPGCSTPAEAICRAILIFSDRSTDSER